MLKEKHRIRQKNIAVIKKDILERHTKVPKHLRKQCTKPKGVYQMIWKKIAIVKKLYHKYVKPTKKKTDIENKIYNFYVRDDISVQAPGKKDTIISNGKVVAKRFMIMTLSEAYVSFKVEYPHANIGKTIFFEKRPSHVKLSRNMPHNMCVCKYHANFGFLLETCSKIVSNSINVTYIPLIERHKGNVHSNEDCLIDRPNSCQNDSCNLESSESCSLCCCSHKSNSPRTNSSCWHLKRRQIIRQSSHASAKNKLEYIETRTKITRQTTLTQKSISLPATPNLSQLRRPVRSTYQKLGEQQSAALDVHMPLTYDQLTKIPQQHHQSAFIPQNNLAALPSPLLSSSLPSDQSMLLKHPGRYDDAQLSTTFGTSHHQHHHLSANNNNNNNNATMCANIVMAAAAAAAASNQTKAAKPTAGCFAQHHNTASDIKPKTQNSPRLGSSGGVLLRCENCCESNGKNSGQNNGLNHTSSYSAMYQPSDAETVSELSSYRFVTDEDLEIFHKNSNDRHQHYHLQTPQPSDFCVNYDDSIENDFSGNQTNNSENYNNNQINENIIITQNERESQPYATNVSHRYSTKKPTSLGKSRNDRVGVDSPSNCCYTIDKSHSDKVIYYQATAVTEPVQIPPRDTSPQDDLLSASLPRNYGSNFEPTTFARQVYIRQSLRSCKNGPPPVPPKPSTNDTEDPSYDPQKFYRKLQRFEKQNNVINQSVTREGLRNSQERSITPERCELLNCFPSYRGRANSTRNYPNNTQESQELQEVRETNCPDDNRDNFPDYSNINYSCKSSSEFPSPKRTLRYDHHGRLKSAHISQLPVTNFYRRNSFETFSPQRSLTHTPIKLTPTLTRKFTYTPKHTITTELREVNEEEFDTNDLRKNQKNQDNITISSVKFDNLSKRSLGDQQLNDKNLYHNLVREDLHQFPAIKQIQTEQKLISKETNQPGENASHNDLQSKSLQLLQSGSGSQLLNSKPNQYLNKLTNKSKLLKANLNNNNHSAITNEYSEDQNHNNFSEQFNKPSNEVSNHTYSYEISKFSNAPRSQSINQYDHLSKTQSEEQREKLRENLHVFQYQTDSSDNKSHHSNATSPLNSPTSPTTLLQLPSPSRLPPRKSHSSPLVLNHDAHPSSPVWLSSETIESQTSSSQKCLDDTQSNCSDQTTIFHFEPDCSQSLSPSSHLYGPQSAHGNTGVNFLKGPLLVKRLPAIQSFGYIPTQSSSLGSANVREYIEKEITMEKRRNTLDRFQRLGFGRKSTPNTTVAANPSTSSNSKQRKSSEKTERLRELTELLRVGGGGQRSSPTPPPVPPPRKQRSSTPSSTSTSFDKTDVSEKSSPSTSLLLAENSANNNNTNMNNNNNNNSSNSTGTSNSNHCSDSSNNEPILSFMSTHSDDILLMDQDEPSSTSKSLRHLQKQISMEAGVLEEKGIEQLKVNNVIDSKYRTSASASTTPLSSPTLKTNASLSNLEVLLMKRENSKSPPTPECVPDNSTHSATKADKLEGSSAIGSYTPKGIPFRSASFSQIDYTSGKYKKSALSALRDRLRRDKSVDCSSPTSSILNSVVENLTWPRKKAEGKASEPLQNLETIEEPQAKKEPDWIYIPLREKSELSINLCYGQDKSLEDVMESPEIIPEEEVFMADTIQEVPEGKMEACISTIQAAHAKMESLTDTIHSDNDYVIDESQVPVTVEANDLMEAKSDSADERGVSLPTSLDVGHDIFEPNVATLMEEQMPLESPPDNFLQTATTCLIPVPVYECAAQEWGLENPPQEWEEVAPEEFIVIPETIEPLVTLEQCNIEKPETKTDKESLPTISVSHSADEMEDDSILRKKVDNNDSVDDTQEEKHQESVDHNEINKSSSHDDIDMVAENRTSLDNIPTRHSSDEKRKADMSKRRKGIYIENWQEPTDSTDGTPPKSLALDISIANLNAIKPDSGEENMMFINSPFTDENRTPASLHSFDLNTPESENRHSPVWTKNHMLSSFSCQSSEEKDDIPLASPPVSLSTSHISLPRQNKSFPFLRNDSVSDNESDRTPPPSKDRSSPVSSEHDFKRFSKRPLRGPYGQMLEAEMKKPQKMHFEEILEELKETDGSLPTRRQRSSPDDAGGRSSTTNVLPHYSNSMRVRKTNANNNNNNNSNRNNNNSDSTYLPVPQHTRAASTPSKMENVSVCGGRGGATDNDVCIIKPLEKKYQSTLDTTSIGRDPEDLVEPATAPATAPASPKLSAASPTSKNKASQLQREQKRASSETPCTKPGHSKRSQSMSSGDKSAAHLQHLHQQKRSLDVTSSASKQHKGGGVATAGISPSSVAVAATSASASSSSSGNSTNILPTPELLAQLLKGSSEKLLSEQRQQMFADTRTHIVQEIFRNEQSYVDSLHTMVNRYLKTLKSPEHAGIIEARTVDEIFFMVPDILEIHEKFLSELRNRLDNWDTQQKVGDAFMETFSKLEVLEVYTSFVNNCSRAKNAIRTTKHQRPSFAKFLETTAREHKGKLTLDYLLIKPVQKFPNYELLFQRLIKHTDHDHPDQKHLQDVLKLVHDILVHINCREREILENGQREATLRELEGVIEGIQDLIAPDRHFLLFDLVAMPSGQGPRKERGFFLFNDLLVVASIKKRSGTIRKPNTTTCPGTVASTLDTNKYKFLTKVSLDSLDIVKTKDENIQRIMTEIENLAEDCNKLQQISDITSSLKCPHQNLEEVIKELHRDVQRQLSEKQTNDAQLNMIELAFNTSGSGNVNQKLAVVFSKSEKRTQWEDTFYEAKHKLAATLERHPIPEFLTSIPIRKTRAGLQFTCAAATLSEKRDVWVCNSDGYVGQVCIMSLHPEPNVTSCNGVCNARILCVASVPAYNPHNASIKSTSSNEDQSSSASSTSAQPLPNQLRSSLPPLSYTQQLLDYRKSISPNYSTPSSLIGTPEKKRDKAQAAVVTSSSSQAIGSSSDIQLDLNLSSSDEEPDANAVASGNVSISSTGIASLGSIGVCERVPSPAPSTHTTGSTSTASTAIVGSSGTLYHGHQDSNPEESDGNQSTMWIGTEDGCIHVYNSTDNIRIKKNRIKIEHHSAVYSILYLDNRVFVALANGDICVYLRDGSAWNTTSSHCLSIGTPAGPVTKLLNVHGRLWCSIQGVIKVLDIETLVVLTQIQISSDSKPITNMCVSNNYVWVSIQNSAYIKCFHSNSHMLITEVNLALAVNKMLSNCDEIIRQHKAACLRVTSLLACRDLIWIGTSAGVLLTIPSQGYEKLSPNVVPTGVPHGHTGHVRFLTFVETTAPASNNSNADNNKDHDAAGSKSPKPKGETAAAAAANAPGNILIISGGDGYEDFRNSGANSLSEIAGREDSTNHLLIWQI